MKVSCVHLGFTIICISKGTSFEKNLSFTQNATSRYFLHIFIRNRPLFVTVACFICFECCSWTWNTCHNPSYTLTNLCVYLQSLLQKTGLGYLLVHCDEFFWKRSSWTGKAELSLNRNHHSWAYFLTQLFNLQTLNEFLLISNPVS